MEFTWLAKRVRASSLLRLRSAEGCLVGEEVLEEAWPPQWGFSSNQDTNWFRYRPLASVLLPPPPIVDIKYNNIYLFNWQIIII